MANGVHSCNLLCSSPRFAYLWRQCGETVTTKREALAIRLKAVTWTSLVGPPFTTSMYTSRNTRNMICFLLFFPSSQYSTGFAFASLPPPDARYSFSLLLVLLLLHSSHPSFCTQMLKLDIACPNSSCSLFHLSPHVPKHVPPAPPTFPFMSLLRLFHILFSTFTWMLFLYP